MITGPINTVLLRNHWSHDIFKKSLLLFNMASTVNTGLFYICQASLETRISKHLSNKIKKNILIMDVKKHIDIDVKSFLT